YVTARRQATVSAQITGTLTDVLIEEGDHVTKGQVLARLEDSAYRANLEAARASARAAQAQVGQLQAQLAQARHDAARQDALVGRGLVARQAAEQAHTQVDALAAQLSAQRRQAEAARAQAQVAQVNFDYTVVRAPFDGVVTDKAAQVGEIISPLSAGGGFTRTGVGTIVDMDSLEVDVDVNEAYIGRVKPHMPAEAVLDAYPDWRIPAHVIAIVPAADRGKATVKVRVALESRDARIVPDMGVRVSFLETRPKAAAQAPRGVLVPAAAIAQRDGHEVVFVVQGERVQQRRVQAQPHGDERLLPEGVQPGETVVVSPPAALRDGAAVRVENKQS
ncbi:MAG TPA: efflux RND transporter periplasmic adaptor subunit, partial [Frateuria sp.]|uniref:efflux RND transporter periplasmic adaptor subunit n=1 Tax=Frateuria sp. TaxID=2211372 RepID=UPI002D7E6EDA